jgi:hypothetical protein
MIVEFSLDIAIPVAKAYEVSQDYSVRYLWDPFPEKIELLDGVTEIAVGAKVCVLAKSGLTMEVQFVQLKPPTNAAIVMTRGPFFLSHFGGSWTFQPVSSMNTRVKFRYSIKLKKWMFPWILNAFVKRYFTRVVKARLLGLKTFCELSV